MKSLLGLLILSMALAGCAKSKSSNLMAPPVTYESVSESGGQINFELNPKVDILFVVDTSKSMEENQSKLLAETENFVSSFGKNGLIDYHIGVISVYDSRRCGQIAPANAPHPGKKLLCHPEGKLRAPFVSRSENAVQQLRENLNIGILEMYSKTLEGEDGPRFEELFFPILVAATPDMNRENGEFFRPDSKVFIIMVTDEDDSSTMSVDMFLSELDKSFGYNRASLYGVAALSQCHREGYADAPDRITKAVQDFGGQLFSICDASYGKSLAKIGSDIREKLLRQQIVLDAIPESGTLELFYGNQNIPEGAGWIYNPETQIITINEDIAIKFDPTARFSVRYTKVSQRSINKGKVHISTHPAVN